MRLSAAVLYKKSTLSVLLALISLSFFGTLTASALMFPKHYDWRYSVISRLLSPRDNPDHYNFAACGVAVSAMLMLPLVGYLKHQLTRIAPKIGLLSAASFIAGIVVLICACFIVPQHTHEVWRIRRMHELFGRSAAGFFALTMLCGCWCAWKTRDQDVSATWLFWIWSAVTLLPLAGLFCSEALLLLTRLEPAWTLPIRAALRHSVFWHLGFWEWTGAAAIFAFVCAAVFLTPSRSVVPSAVTRHEEGSCSCS
jgi:hypothetical protein